MLPEIIAVAGENATRQFEVLDKSAQNIANLNTVGYKAQRFEQYLRADGVLAGVSRTNYSQGASMATGRELDIAIEGEGFIPVTQRDGTVAYTRDGSLAKNEKGYLVTNRGDLVGTGIQIPPFYERIKILSSGEVQIYAKDNPTPSTIGKIDLVKFVNPEGLSFIGGNKVLPSQESGPAITVQNHQAIAQGKLENANVQAMDEISQILRLNAAVISNLRVIKLSDDLLRQSVNLKQ